MQETSAESPVCLAAGSAGAARVDESVLWRLCAAASDVR